jgi:hypothetical protein
MKFMRPILISLTVAALLAGCSQPPGPTAEEELMATMSITERGLIGTWQGSIGEGGEEGLPDTMTDPLASEMGGNGLKIQLDGSNRTFELSLTGYVIEGSWLLEGDNLNLTPSEDVIEPLNEDLDKDGRFSFAVIDGGEEILWESETGSPITFTKTD